MGVLHSELSESAAGFRHVCEVPVAAAFEITSTFISLFHRPLRVTDIASSYHLKQR